MLQNTNANQVNTTDDKVLAKQLQSIVFSSVWAILLLYVIIAMLCFLLKAKNGRNTANDRNDSANSSITVGSTVLEIMTLIVACAVFGYMVIELPLIRPQNDPFCQIYHRISAVLGITTLGSIYFVLWFRIYAVFYRHALIKTVTSRKICFLSKLACVMLVLMIITNSYAFLSADSYVTTTSGCVKLPDKSHTSFKWGLLVSSTIIFQIMLLGLFIYPLVLHRNNMLHIGFDSKSVIPVIKRAFVTTAVCIISDSLNGVYAIINEERITYVRHTLYGINLIVNLIALICSSADWKEKLFPFRFFCLRKAAHQQRVCKVYHIPNLHAIESYP